MTGILPDFLGETVKRINLKSYPQVRQFVVQHLYPDTLRLLLLLHKHVELDCVIGIGYSGDSRVVETLEAEGIRVLTPDFNQLQDTIKKELVASLQRCQEHNSGLVIHEVGGYAIKTLHSHCQEHIHLVKGALEITKQGVWVAQEIPHLKIPQLNCAQTRLKQIEGKMVGDAVAAALDTILRNVGLSMVGRKALVTGYGWVGAGTAQSLRTRGMDVNVFDIDTIKLVEASVDGFAICRTTDSIGSPQFIIGVSGRQSITANIIDQLPSNSFIVSGASKDHEADLPYLQSQSQSINEVHKHIDAHTLKDGRIIYLVNKGYPVNFTGSSVPDEIVEFLFSELIMLMQVLLENPPQAGIYPLSNELEEIAADIWLSLR